MADQRIAEVEPGDRAGRWIELQNTSEVHGELGPIDWLDQKQRQEGTGLSNAFHLSMGQTRETGTDLREGAEPSSPGSQFQAEERLRPSAAMGDPEIGAVKAEPTTAMSSCGKKLNSPSAVAQPARSYDRRPPRPAFVAPKSLSRSAEN